MIFRACVSRRQNTVASHTSHDPIEPSTTLSPATAGSDSIYGAYHRLAKPRLRLPKYRLHPQAHWAVSWQTKCWVRLVSGSLTLHSRTHLAVSIAGLNPYDAIWWSRNRAVGKHLKTWQSSRRWRRWLTGRRSLIRHGQSKKKNSAM